MTLDANNIRVWWSHKGVVCWSSWLKVHGTGVLWGNGWDRNLGKRATPGRPAFSMRDRRCRSKGRTTAKYSVGIPGFVGHRGLEEWGME